MASMMVWGCASVEIEWGWLLYLPLGIVFTDLQRAVDWGVLDGLGLIPAGPADFDVVDMGGITEADFLSEGGGAEAAS